MGIQNIQTSFCGGEWSPLLEGRVDLQKYSTSLLRMENFLIDPHGPAVFRPGFKFVKETKVSATASRLIPFVFSADDAVMLEFGAAYIRFYKDQAQVLSGASAYEIVSPYAAADLALIKYCQSADVLYLFHPDYAPRKLSRLADTSWVLSVINFKPPPTSEQGLKPATTLTPAATTGTGKTFTAGASVFLAADVNRVIRSGASSASITAVSSGTQVVCDIIDDFPSTAAIASQSWEMTGSPSAAVTPSAKSPVGAIISLNTGAVDCFRAADVGKYVIINSGFVKITSYSAATEVYGQILKELSAVTATTSWTLEASLWSATNGYPSCGTFYEERLLMAGVPAFPENTRSSQTGDYENCTPGVDDADSLDFTCAGRLVNKIVWLEPREYLILGTVGSEWRLGPEDTGDPLTPLNVIAKQQTTFGCADIMPLTVGHSTLFVQRALRKIREFTWDYMSDGYVAPDMTLLAEHITESGIVGMVYQQEPLSIVWAWLVDGSMIGMTYIREQDVVGWHKHPIDGEVESMATIPGDGYDEVWAIIKRSINGSTVRYVELMAKQFTDDADTFTDNKGLNAFFVDCGITYNGAAATVITGLDHLEGEDVTILADGAVRPVETVSGGQITLDRSASVVHVGLPYTGTIQTMRPEFALRDGTAQGKMKRIVNLFVRIHNSGTFKTGRDEDHLDPVLFRSSDMPMGSLPDLFTGDKQVSYDGSFDRDARLFIVQDNPLPLTVVAIIAEVSV